MKKFVSVIFSLVFCMLIMTACTTSANLQTRATDLGVLDFFYSTYIANFSAENAVASANANQLSASDRVKVKNLTNYNRRMLMQEVAVFAGLDYYESAQDETSSKLWLYEFTESGNKYNLEVEKDAVNRKVVLKIDGEEKINITLTIKKESEQYVISYTYAEKKSEMKVLFDKDKGCLKYTLKTREINAISEDATYQEVEVRKTIYDLYSNIKYYSVAYELKNNAGTVSSRYGIEGYSVNVQSKIKYYVYDTSRAESDITSLAQKDLASPLVSDLYSIIFEKNEASIEDSAKYTWQNSGESTAWKNYIG